MNTEDNLAILKNLDRKGVRASRNATLVAWLSVVGAAAVMALLIYLANHQLQLLRRAADDENLRLVQLKQQSDTLTIEIKKKSEEIENLKPLAENYEALRQSQRPPLAVSATPPAPPTTPPGKPIPPRVYLQIVNQADREYAERMGMVLQKAGFTVPGIEYVGRAAGLRNTEVRYYKKVEEAEAKKVADILRAETKELIAVLYLGLENAKVRDRHYEVWFRAQNP